MKKLLVLLVAVLLVSSPLLTRAARFESGSSVTVGTDETIFENFYGFGRNVSVVGDVGGDAVLAGGKIFISGSVAHDVLAAGGTIDLVGSVGEDVRVAGGDVTIAGSVGGDVVVAGGTVHIVSGAFIGGDVVAAGGTVIFEGETSSLLRLAGGSLTVNGVVNGDTVIAGGDDIVVGKNAVLKGSFTYHSPREARIEEGAAIIGEVSFQPVENAVSAPQKNSVGMAKKFFLFLGVWWFMKVLMILVGALVLFAVARSWVVRFAEESVRGFGFAPLYGVASIVLTPIAVIILCVSVVGFLLGVSVAFSYVLFVILTSLLSGIVTGYFFFTKIAKKKNHMMSWVTVVAGVLLFEIVKLIPIIGWIVCVVVFFHVAGVLTRKIYLSFK